MNKMHANNNGKHNNLCNFQSLPELGQCVETSQVKEWIHRSFKIVAKQTRNISKIKKIKKEVNCLYRL